jgi:hypothetical protein
MRTGEEREVFCDAVRDLSDAPTPVNVRRYLAASRLLDVEAAREGARRQR